MPWMKIKSACRLYTMKLSITTVGKIMKKLRNACFARNILFCKRNWCYVTQRISKKKALIMFPLTMLLLFGNFWLRRSTIVKRAWLLIGSMGKSILEIPKLRHCYSCSLNHLSWNHSWWGKQMMLQRMNGWTQSQQLSITILPEILLH